MLANVNRNSYELIQTWNQTDLYLQKSNEQATTAAHQRARQSATKLRPRAPWAQTCRSSHPSLKLSNTYITSWIGMNRSYLQSAKYGKGEHWNDGESNGASICQRKFRSQTSDNMDRWKAEQGRGREKRKIRRKKSKKKEDADARKGRKVAKHCVFPMICGSGGSKSRLAKAAGAEPAGERRDEKLHAVVARSTFASQNVQNTRGARSTFGTWDVEKVHAVWREAHFQVKMYKTHHVRTIFGGLDVVSRGRRKGLCTLSKVTKTWEFCSISKNDGRHGTLEEDLQRCMFVAGAVQKTCSSEMLGGQGADFLRGVAFWSIKCAGLLRWFCVTGAALRMTWHQFSVAGAVL